MTFAPSHCEYGQEAKAKPRARVDFSAAKHFVGIFALGFSGATWYAVLHFMFHVV